MALHSIAAEMIFEWKSFNLIKIVEYGAALTA